MDAEPYPYQYPTGQVNIEESAPPFRLLHLWPGIGENSLCGEIHETQLDSFVAQNGAYEALSYCCGDATEVARIAIKSHGGGYLPLGKNLQNALLGLRLSDVPRVLWVDAICINQNDLEERAREVRQMHRIYQCAQKVLIWLDQPAIRPKYWNPELAFAFASRLAELRETEPELDIKKMNRIQIVLAGCRYKFKRHIVGWKTHERPPDALRLIFAQLWFERMWVVQEATCATSAVFICGDSSIDFDIFMQGIEFGLRSGFFVTSRQQHGIKPKRVDAPLSNVSAVMEMYLLHSQSSPGGNLLSLLRRFHGSKSADPRDKLFALYGISSLDRMSTLARDFTAIEIVPDYQIDPIVLYTKVARGILQQSQTLDLLSIPSRHDNITSKVKNLPSWVPDWSVVNQRTAALYYDNSTRYSASKDSKFTPEATSPNNGFLPNTSESPSRSTSTLTLSGFYLDRIAEVGIRPLNKSWKVWNNPSSASRPDLTVMVTLELWIWQIVDWQYDLLPEEDNINNTNTRVKKPLTVEEVVSICTELIHFTRNQWETPWYITATKQHQQSQLQPQETSPPQHTWSHKVAQLLSNLQVQPQPDSPNPGPKSSTKAILQALFFATVMLSMFSKGLIRGIYDDAIVQSRTLARTETGYIGLVPVAARPGDSVALCMGGGMPLVIRLDDSSISGGDGVKEEREGEGEVGRERERGSRSEERSTQNFQPKLRLKLIGDAYIHGVMNGEAWTESRCGPIVLS